MPGERSVLLPVKLQVRVSEAERAFAEEAAAEENLTVAAWVRSLVRDARKARDAQRRKEDATKTTATRG